MLPSTPSLEEVQALLAPDESAASFFRRIQCERCLTGLGLIDRNVSLRPGVVLEAAGPHGSGKTELLLQVALNVLLAVQHGNAAPPDAASAWRGGALQQQSSVVILDLDAKFDALRLVQVHACMRGGLGLGCGWGVAHTTSSTWAPPDAPHAIINSIATAAEHCHAWLLNHTTAWGGLCWQGREAQATALQLMRSKPPATLPPPQPPSGATAPSPSDLAAAPAATGGIISASRRDGQHGAGGHAAHL